MSENQSPEPDMDTAAAAEDLGVTVSTLASWRSLGRGPSYWKYGRKVRYSRAVNAAWKAQQKCEPTPAKLRREQAAAEIRRS